MNRIKGCKTLDYTGWLALYNSLLSLGLAKKPSLRRFLSFGFVLGGGEIEAELRWAIISLYLF